jgi:hypothetical protein
MLYIQYHINFILTFGKFSEPDGVSQANTNDNQKFHKLTTEE